MDLKHGITIVLLLWTVTFLTFATGAVPQACETCQKSHQCFPPECVCCSDELRFTNVTLSKIPQMVFFTFDDAVTGQAAGFYKQLFDPTRKNPNGCPITMTLFISHENTQYAMVSEFHSQGMEIASHSVTHSTMNGSNFYQEAKEQKDNLAKLAGIPIEDIVGWRSPFLKPAGDLQPDSLKKLGYNYDATLTFSKRSFNERPPGPFTLDFGYPYECQVKPCPKHKHPGFWEIPVVSLMDYKKAYDCVYVDGCMNPPPDEESAYQFLWENFYNYYTTTRMPFGINMHPSWFYYPDRLKAMDRFIQKLVSLNDVYIISANRVLEWLKQPTPLQDLHSFSPWACDGSEKNVKRGPRLVIINVAAPPPVPRSFIQWSRDTTQVFTPAPPVTGVRSFTVSHFTPAVIATAESKAQTPDAGNKLFTLDLTREADRQRQRLLELRRTPRGPEISMRRSNDFAPAVRQPLSHQQLLEQHEERMRQRQIIRERMREQQLEEHRRIEQEQQLQQQRQMAIDAEQQRERLERLRRERIERQQYQMQMLRNRRRQEQFQQRQEQRRQLLQEQRQQQLQQQQQQQQQEQQQQQQFQRQQLPSQSVQISHTESQPASRQPQTFSERRVLWSPSVEVPNVPNVERQRADRPRSWVPEGIRQETARVWQDLPLPLEPSNPIPNIPVDTGAGNQPDNLLAMIQNPSSVGYVPITPAPVPVQNHRTGTIEDFWNHGPPTVQPHTGGVPRSNGLRIEDSPRQWPRETIHDSANVRPHRIFPGTHEGPHMLPDHGMPPPRHSRRPSPRQQRAWNSFIRNMLGPH